MTNYYDSGYGYWDDKMKKFLRPGDAGYEAKKDYSNSSNGNSPFSGSGRSNKSKCKGHDGATVLDFHGMLISGYKKSEVPIATEKTLVVNLTGSSFDTLQWPVKKLPAALNLLDKKEDYGIDLGEELLIDWPDGKGIAIRPQWWLDALTSMKAADYKNVRVCCVGGHGRTGTALACFLVAAGCKTIKNGDDAVRVVRSLHCEECIESNSQLDYIDYVCGFYKIPKTKTTVAA